jgi:hypothetical protein
LLHLLTAGIVTGFGQRLEHQHKRSLQDDVSRLKGLMPWIGSVTLAKLHLGVLQPWIAERRRSGVSAGTINHGLQIIRRILNLVVHGVDG